MPCFKDVHGVLTFGFLRRPPFAIVEGTAACSALRNLAAEHHDIGKNVHVLDVLRAFFKDMGGRDTVTEKWLQRSIALVYDGE